MFLKNAIYEFKLNTELLKTCVNAMKTLSMLFLMKLLFVLVWIICCQIFLITQVSNLDDQLFDLLSERMSLSEQVGQLKRENNITILQQEHWRKVINNRLGKSDEYHLTEKFVRQFMDAIHQESIRHQTAIMNPINKING